MPTVIPFVPQNITVHLAGPDTTAANVTLPFADYVKNVASSEIYPTWEESALRANIFAIVSFALNRVYTEFYRSRGYDFDITSSTAIDQAFVNGRSYFENISRLVDELFNDYLRRPGFVEPLASKFCNGTTVTCEGLSQWGSQNLALQGLNSTQILRSYYGNIEIVNNAPIMGITSSYPGTPLRRGSSVDGIFGSRTEASVRAFQQIFGLSPDGVVGKATWYALVRLYTAVTRLSELRSQGQQFYSVNWEFPDALSQGDRGEKVRLLQYMLAILAEFIDEIPPITVDGIFGPATASAVRAAQGWLGLPITGSVDDVTWDEIYDQFSGIENSTLRSGETFPAQQGNNGSVTANRNRYARSATMTQFPGENLQTGSRDPVKQEVVR